MMPPLHSAMSAGASGSPRTSATPVRTRLRYQIVSRVWVAGGAEYDSGLPFRVRGDPGGCDRTVRSGDCRSSEFRPVPRQTQSVARCRSRSGFVEDGQIHCAAAGAEHINNRFNLLDFASLFSGTAIEPPRSYALRLTC